MLIAAGGTGGHLFPGIAVARELLALDPVLSILFVVSEKGMEKRILEREGFSYEVLPVGRLKGEGGLAKVITLALFPKAIWQARRLLKRVQPDAILGIGGYSSGPILFGAWLLRIPRAILEPNAIPGLTNRVLGRLADRVFVAFPAAAGRFRASKVTVTGTPVRRSLTEVGEGREGEASCRLADRPFSLLVVGGSQGARSLNRAVVDLLPILEREGERSGRRFRIVHQTGPQDRSWVEEAYVQSSIPHEVHPFIEDMKEAYRTADLVVSRAGASAIAEQIETRTPAILVPYPFAADDHQRWNALSLVEAGGAEVIPDRDLANLASRILALEGDREILRRMRENLAALRGKGAEPAARVVARACIEMALP